MTDSNSYRTILRSSAIMGAASVVNVISGLFKMKVAAVLLGPAGVGLIGLYQSLMQTGATVSALGLGTVGTRQIAAANADGGGAAVGRVRRALFWFTLALSVLGALVFLACSRWLATPVLGDPEQGTDVAWLALGVALTVAAGSQGALLTGLRQIGDLARVQVASGVFGAVLGVIAIWVWGIDGLIGMVLVAPIITFLAGHWFVARLGRPEGPSPHFRELVAEWRDLARLGIPFMLSGLVTVFGNLAVRTLVQARLGTEDLGQFQAAWTIGMTYLAFVLGAMATDYYPRLSGEIKDHAAASHLVNQQTEVALLLCGPVLLAMMALAPGVMWTLYSPEFAPAVEILRWQVLGDVLKVVSWPLGFVLLAAGAGRTFIMTEMVGMVTFLLCVALGTASMGVTATGIGFFAMYAAYLPLVYLLARRRIGFRWSPRVARHAAIIFGSASIVFLLSDISEALAAGVGVLLSLAMAAEAIIRLASMASLGGRIGRLASWLQRLRPGLARLRS